MNKVYKKIFTDLDFISKEEVYSFLSKEISLQFHSNIFGSLLKREEISSIQIDDKTVLPHFESEYVNESKIIIVRLKNEIEVWSENIHNIKLIICLALKINETNDKKKQIKEFVSKLANEDTIKYLLDEDLKNIII